MTLVRLLIDPLLDDATPTPYLLMVIPILISALLGGFLQGLFATALSTLVSLLLWIEPGDSLAIETQDDALQLTIFLTQGVVVSVLGASVQRMIRERSALLAGETAARAFADEGRKRYQDLMENLGVALYTTDASGRITYFNDAAVELWGRSPELGTDEWCGSWRLYNVDGTPMAHEDCPLAVTLKTGEPVRNAEAIAERPDGTRVNFVPYPSPLHSASGELTGAVNVLIDITERRRAEDATRIAEERLRNLHDNAVFGIFQTDA
jgi:PAS domain S-box-containing protein